MSDGVRVKICGLKEAAHAAAAVGAGADYIGVVFAERIRSVTPQEARAVVDALEGATQAVAVFVDALADDILRYRDRVGFSVAQLHGAESPADAQALRDEGLVVWKAIRPTSREALGESWQAFSEATDALLVEGFSPEAAGGTGSAFPHEWLSAIDRSGPDLVLAGGLNADNVMAAIRDGRPNVVDVSSGVEVAPGIKSIDRINAFLSKVRGPVSGASPVTPREETP